MRRPRRSVSQGLAPCGGSTPHGRAQAPNECRRTRCTAPGGQQRSVLRSRVRKLQLLDSRFLPPGLVPARGEKPRSRRSPDRRIRAARWCPARAEGRVANVDQPALDGGWRANTSSPAQHLLAATFAFRALSSLRRTCCGVAPSAEEASLALLCSCGSSSSCAAPPGPAEPPDRQEHQARCGPLASASRRAWISSWCCSAWPHSSCRRAAAAASPPAPLTARWKAVSPEPAWDRSSAVTTSPPLVLASVGLVVLCVAPMLIRGSP